MQDSEAALREEVQKLAEEAFHHQLISGYGDGEFPDKFQIVYKGKTRHFPLEKARLYLRSLLNLEADPPLFRVLFNRKRVRSR